MGLKGSFAKIGIWITYALTVSLYFPMMVTNIVTGIACFYLLYGVLVKRIRFQKTTLFLIIPFALLYGLIFVGYLYDQPKSYVWTDLEKKASLLLIPGFFGLIRPSILTIRRVLQIYFWTGFCMVSLALLLSLYSFMDLPDLRVLANHDLSMNVGFHATYLSLYLLFSLIYPVLEFRRLHFGWYKRLLLTASAITIVYLLLLNSRIALLLLFGSIVIFIWYGSGLTLRRKLLFFIGVMVLIGNTFWLKPVRERFKEMINYENQYDVSEVWGGRGIRTIIWKESSELVQERILTGYGSSTAVQEALNTRYKSEGIGPLLYMMRQGKSFNPHNQFLSDILKYGIILGNCFVPFLGHFLFDFTRHRNIIGTFLVIVLVGFCFTETIFELNKGIVFVCFFIPLSHYCRMKISKS